jgi:hypothetical protein
MVAPSANFKIPHFVWNDTPVRAIENRFNCNRCNGLKSARHIGVFHHWLLRPCD